jgi:phage terminase small subunit
VRHVKLTERQKRFAKFYIESGNAYKAAIKAGYSEKYAKADANRLLEYPSLKSYITPRLQKLDSEQIASASEVLTFLTSVLRGNVTEEIPIFFTKGVQKLAAKNPTLKDRVKAAELLAKRYALLTDNVKVDGNLPVVIAGDGELQ